MILAQVPVVDNPWMAIAVISFFALQAWQLWVSSKNTKGITEVHGVVNSRMTELLELTRKASVAQGGKEERERAGSDVAAAAERGWQHGVVDRDKPAPAPVPVVATAAGVVKVAIVSVPGVPGPATADAPEPPQAGPTDRPFDMKREIYP